MNLIMVSPRFIEIHGLLYFYDSWWKIWNKILTYDKKIILTKSVWILSQCKLAKNILRKNHLTWVSPLGKKKGGVIWCVRGRAPCSQSCHHSLVSSDFLTSVSDQSDLVLKWEWQGMKLLSKPWGRPFCGGLVFYVYLVCNNDST